MVRAFAQFSADEGKLARQWAEEDAKIPLFGRMQVAKEMWKTPPGLQAGSLCSSRTQLSTNP